MPVTGAAVSIVIDPEAGTTTLYHTSFPTVAKLRAPHVGFGSSELNVAPKLVVAIVLTPGGVFIDNVIDTTNLGATLSSELPNPTTCGALNFATVGKDVWYSVVVPASGSITIETAAPVTGTIDTVITVYSGTCSTTLVQVGCNDDIATGTNNYSRISLTGQIAGDVLLARVFGYNGAQGRFKISAYDGSLGNSSFDNANFTGLG